MQICYKPSSNLDEFLIAKFLHSVIDLLGYKNPKMAKNSGVILINFTFAMGRKESLLRLSITFRE